MSDEWLGRYKRESDTRLTKLIISFQSFQCRFILFVVRNYQASSALHVDLYYKICFVCPQLDSLKMNSLGPRITFTNQS